MESNQTRLRIYTPHPLLAPLVQGYWIMEAGSLRSAEVRYLHPDGGHGISLNFGDAIPAQGGAMPAGVSLGSRLLVPRALTFGGQVRLAGIRLRPEGAYPLFGTAALTGDAFRRGELEELFERARGSGSPRALVVLFDSWLLGRRAHGELAPAVGEAIRRIRKTHGALRVGDLAGELEVSPRHLERLFRARVGYTPKQLARITRVRRAKGALAAGDGPLAQIAARFGYADQAHFTREFSQIIGIPPAEYLLRRAANERHIQRRIGA